MTPRIQCLLERALAHDVIPAPVCVEFDPADETLPEPVRIGKRLAETIAAQPVAIREDEEFVGWLPFDGSVEADLYRRSGHRAFGDLFREWYRKPRENLAIFEWQHTCADFPAIVAEGLEGVRRRVEASRAAYAGDRARLDYLDGLSLALDAIVARQRKSAAECRRLAGIAESAGDGIRAAALHDSAVRLDRVPLHPARTFDEGVQAVFFCYDLLSDAIGRLDQYLAPLYFADLKAGRTTPVAAAERLQELWIFIDSHTPHASANYDKGGECHMTVGGLHPDGSDGWTDFSRLVVESVLELPLKRPEMSFRWHPGTSRETLRHMLDRERRDAEKRIAFDGDPPRIAAFVRRLGLPVELARDYCITGCNEPTFMGGVSFGGLHVNALRCIATLFTKRRCDVLACRDWDAFAALFKEEWHRDLGRALDISKEFNALRARDCNILSALLLAGCVERAESPTRGGASREVPVMDLLGTPNLIDSLSIVRQFVFEERRCTMERLAAALDADWQGNDAAGLLAEIRRDGRFYGANDPFTNGIAHFVYRSLARFADGATDYFGLPMTYGNHTGYNDNFATFGALTPATPDGRRAGEALSFGSGPAAGRGPDAATSVLLAAAKMDPDGVLCGTSILNLSVSEAVVRNEESFEKLVALVETYFKEGGYHLQLNHVSRETLLDAKANPDAHRALRVRISGFSAYFTGLKESMQDEVIARTECRT
jgi:formate C-acetyltransferase